MNDSRGGADFKLTEGSRLVNQSFNASKKEKNSFILNLFSLANVIVSIRMHAFAGLNSLSSSIGGGGTSKLRRQTWT